MWIFATLSRDRASRSRAREGVRARARERRISYAATDRLDRVSCANRAVAEPD